MVLLFAPAIDELCSAAPTVTAPSIQSDLELTTTTLATLALVLPLLLSLLLEPMALWLADGRWRRSLLLGASWGWAGSLAMAGWADSPKILGLALLLAGPASGITLGVAQVALLAHTSNPGRALNRWTLSAALGDLAGPIVYAVVLALGGSWRHLFLLFAGILGLYSVACSRFSWDAQAEESKGKADGADLREALKDRTLILWLLAVTACTLLDEITVMLCALWMTDLPSGGPILTSLGVMGFLAGMVISLLAIDRGWVAGRLEVSCWVSLLGLILVILMGSVLWTVIGFFILGLGAGPQYPLTLARAHARRPDRPGLVLALREVLAPIDLALPLLIGLCADRFGLGWALTCLAAQPFCILVVARMLGPSSLDHPS